MDQTMFEFLNNLLISVNNGNKVSKNLLTGLSGNAKKLSAYNETILKLIEHYNVLEGLYLTGGIYNYIPLSNYKKQFNHSNAIIYNKKFNMYEHQVISIKYKYRLTK